MLATKPSYPNSNKLVALGLGDDRAWGEFARIEATPSGSAIGFDVESTGLDQWDDKLILMQFKPEDRAPLLLDVRDQDSKALYQALLPIFSDPNKLIRGHNLVFDIGWLLTYVGLTINQLQCKFEDTMLNELVILGMGQSDARNKGLAVNMLDTAARYGLAVHKEERNWFIGLDQRPEEWAAPFPEQVLAYARQDVSVVHSIAKAQKKLLDQYNLNFVASLEGAVLPAVAGMSFYGMDVDKDKWMDIVKGIAIEANELAEQLHEAIDVSVLAHRTAEWNAKNDPYQQWRGQKNNRIMDALRNWPDKQKGWGEYKKQLSKEFDETHPKPTPPTPLKEGVNLDSPAQILVALQARGHQIVSVKEEVLTPLAALDPVVQLYLDYKDKSTALTKYGQEYLDEHAKDGTIRAFIQQIGAETGRVAFRKPNVQQIPARGAGAELRRAIKARPGFVFIDFDFTAVELMITADLTRDPVMLQAFKDGADLHARTAEVMFDLLQNKEYVQAMADGVTPKFWTDNHNAVVNGKELSASYRSIAKTINFGLLYGMGAYRLAATLRIDVDSAKTLMNLYRETYKTAVGWLRSQGDKVKSLDANRRTYASTVAGRRRWFEVPQFTLPRNVSGPDAKAAKKEYEGKIAGIQRKLGNHPIQGTSADITKYAMALWHKLYNSPDMRLVCCVHDELILEVKDDPYTIEQARKGLAEVMGRGLHKFLRHVTIKPVDGKTSYFWDH